MEAIGLMIFVVAWIWSVAKGIQVSVLCCVLNFIFPPIAQCIYSIYEETVRGPFFGMLIGMIILWFTEGLTFS